MNKSIPLLAAAIACLIAGSVAGPAMARMPAGSIGNGGRMPETMSPGALPPPANFAPSGPASTPMTSFGAARPDTGSNSLGGFQSQGASSGTNPSSVH
jgi:hypothetical protein